MKLFDFQKDALDATKGYDSCAYYHTMGLGKTYTGGEKLMSFNSKTNLVVCQKSKVSDWMEHMSTHYGDVANTFNLTKKRELTQFLECSERKVGVINYDLLKRREEIANLSDIAAVFDESSLLKNDGTKLTKFVMKLKLSHVVLLSGTPVGGKYEELWSQCRLLGLNMSKEQFWNEYILSKDWQPAPFAKPIKLVIGYKNIPDLKLMLRGLGAHFLKCEDVLTLPEQMFTPIWVSTSKEYGELMTDGVTTIDDVDLVADMPLKKLLYARQLCSVHSKDKLSAFVDWAESNNSRLIVFYNFNDELTAMTKALGKNRPISVVNGSTKDLSAYETADNSITFIQYQAGALGLNLQKANHIAYYSLPLSSELYEQSKKRIHRIGQSKTCFYYWFICKDSVEEQILETLKKRNDFTLELFR